MGDLFRFEAIGEDGVFFNSGPTLQAILSSGAVSHLHKIPLVYGKWKPFISNGVLVSDGKLWETSRKILLRTQRYGKLCGHMELLNRACKRLITNLELQFADERFHTVYQLLTNITLEIIIEMVTGDTLDKSSEVFEYCENISFWKKTLPIHLVNPLTHIKYFWKLHPRYKRHTRACVELSNFAKRRIADAKAKRKQNAGDNYQHDKFRSMVDDLLDAGVNEQQIVEEINVMIFAGHDTTASALHSLCFSLALHPDIQEQARQEVDELFADQVCVKDGNIQHCAIQRELKYVERCILETLRLLPPVFFVGRKLQSPLTVEYKGMDVTVPTGTNCIIVPFVVHRLERHYPNPLQFNPDRFLQEEIEKRHPYIYIPFLAGPRNCLGQKLAMIEMKTVIAHILRNFELTTTDKMEDVKWLPYTTLTPDKDFAFKFTKRTLNQ